MAHSKDSYHGQLALITGGSSGIGLALARELALEGANIWLMSRRKEALQSAVESLACTGGQKHGFVPVDVSNWEQVQSAVRRVEQEAGVPDLLANCAGVVYPGYAHDLPLEVYREMMDIDYLGTVHVTKALLPAMLKRGNGSILNVSSAAGYASGPSYAAYSPAKFAVRGFSDALRAEMKPLGIKVFIVFPPDTDTPQLAFERAHRTPEFQRFYDDAGLGPIKFGVKSAEQVAQIILKDMRRGRYVILPGAGNYILFHVARLLGNAAYPIIDDQWKTARQTKSKK